MDIISVLRFISIILILYKIIEYISSKFGNKESNLPSEPEGFLRSKRYELLFGEKDRLERFQSSEINYPYKSVTNKKIIKKNVEQLLHDNQFVGFDICDVIALKNVIYIEFSFNLGDFDSTKQSNDYASHCSLNYIEANNTVTIYGIDSSDNNVKHNIQKFADQLINKL